MVDPSPDRVNPQQLSAGRLDVTAFLLVFVGGVVGTALRLGVYATLDSTKGSWPWATFAVNLVGAFLLGRVVRRLGSSHRRPHLEPMLATGFAGALTTFSTFAVETIDLAVHAGAASAVLYAGASVTLGLLAAAWGLGVSSA